MRASESERTRCTEAGYWDFASILEGSSFSWNISNNKMASDISLEAIKNETVDLVSFCCFYWSRHESCVCCGCWWIVWCAYIQERIPIDEVFNELKCSREGLSSAEGAKRLEIFGPNKLEEKKESKFLKFLGFMWNPLSWVMESAAVMAIVLANGGV